MRTMLFICLLTSVSSAQWLNYPDPHAPRTKDGKVDLTGKAPRTPDGKPDLSGVWHVQAETLEEKRKLFGASVDAENVATVPGMEVFTTSKYTRDVMLDYKPGEIVLTPEGEAMSKAVRQRRNNDCLPFGPVMAALLSEVQKIVQMPGLTIIMLELDSMNRQIYTDGRKLPEDPSPSWQGYSVGRRDNDTFVVDTIGFNGRTFLDVKGRPLSESMHLTEQFHRRDFGHLDVQVTFDDPKVYSKPFSIKVTHLLQPDSDILEYVCAENEKDRAHLVGR